MTNASSLGVFEAAAAAAGPRGCVALLLLTDAAAAERIWPVKQLTQMQA